MDPLRAWNTWQNLRYTLQNLYPVPIPSPTPSLVGSNFTTVYTDRCYVYIIVLSQMT